MEQRKWAKDTEKLGSFELAKLEKDGLDVLNDVERYAELGFAAIEPTDIDRMKWLGIYVSRPKTEGNLMLRVKIPGGILNSQQARMLSDLSREYGRNLMDVTTRQSIQFHWIRVEMLPDIFKRLENVGLTTIESAGDCPRNVIGSPIAGIDSEEFFDTGSTIRDLNGFFTNNREFSNLPRKFKISVCGNPYNSVNAEINDLSFVPAVKTIDGVEIKGFNVFVGGGLSTAPQLAQKVDVFVRPGEVVKVAAATCAIFRDFGYREKRNHARLKFLISDWGIAKFTDELLKITGPLLDSGKDLTKGWNAGFYYGVNKQKQPGLNYVGLAVPAGRFSAEEMADLARIADEYGDGNIRTAGSQNIVLANIPDNKIDNLLQEKLLNRVTPFPKPFTGHTVTCTGKEFCPFAVAETKNSVSEIISYLDENVKLDTPVHVHFSGCANSCGQPQIADIGFQGTLVLVDGQPVEAFEMLVGGRLGTEPVFARKLEGRIPVEKTAQAIEYVIEYYKKNKDADESFYTFVGRNSASLQDKLREFLAR